MRTTNAHLQERLDAWAVATETAGRQPQGSSERFALILQFCDSFVPLGLDAEDLAYYSKSLHDDEELFGSLQRELRQCASGDRVESIKGDQRTRAIFTLLAPEGLETTLDIVREVAFISSDGVIWTAEG